MSERDELEKTLARLDEICRQVREEFPPGSPIELSAEYLRGVAWQESLPENQSGADKSWVGRALRAHLAHYANARRIR